AITLDSITEDSTQPSIVGTTSVDVFSTGAAICRTARLRQQKWPKSSSGHGCIAGEHRLPTRSFDLFDVR
ncbi:MAG TPA: hypothetical protein VGM32_05380, partial [Rhodopila sp.]